MMMRFLCAIAVLVLAACSDSNPGTYSSGALRVSAVAIQANPHNALSFVFTFQAVSADSARVLYTAPGDTGETPWSSLVTGANRITVLGLLPAVQYNLTLQVVGAN